MLRYELEIVLLLRRRATVRLIKLEEKILFNNLLLDH